MQKIVSAKKTGDNNLYFFSCAIEAKAGERVVVEFEEFQTIATIINENVTCSKINSEELGKVVRFATDADLKKYESLKQKAKSEVPIFKKKSLELGLMMKFVAAEYSLDNSKILIVFSSEERVDFRQLLKDLASMLKTRIELKQIGQRDEIKMIGAVGPCGEPCCCARFLKEFEHVTVKMAKVQALSLSPTKINGVCGRLMCCLGYESPMYEEQIAKMPKINSEVETPNGKGTVVYNDILRERVSVKRQAEGDTIVVEEFELGDLKGYEKYKKAEEPKEEQKAAETDVKTSFEKPENHDDREFKNKHHENKDFSNYKNEFNKNKSVENKWHDDKSIESKPAENNNDEQKNNQSHHFGNKKHHHGNFFHKNNKN